MSVFSSEFFLRAVVSVVVTIFLLQFKQKGVEGPSFPICFQGSEVLPKIISLFHPVWGVPVVSFSWASSVEKRIEEPVPDAQFKSQDCNIIASRIPNTGESLKECSSPRSFPAPAVFHRQETVILWACQKKHASEKLSVKSNRPILIGVVLSKIRTSSSAKPFSFGKKKPNTFFLIDARCASLEL